MSNITLLPGWFYLCGAVVSTCAFNMLVLMQQSVLSSFLFSLFLDKWGEIIIHGNQHCFTNTGKPGGTFLNTLAVTWINGCGLQSMCYLLCALVNTSGVLTFVLREAGCGISTKISGCLSAPVWNSMGIDNFMFGKKIQGNTKMMQAKIMIGIKKFPINIKKWYLWHLSWKLLCTESQMFLPLYWRCSHGSFSNLFTFSLKNLVLIRNNIT